MSACRAECVAYLTALALLIQSVVGSVAWAEAQLPPPSAADIDKARAHFRAGESYYGHKMFPDAAREFEVAYRLSRRPALLYNIGKSWDSSGDVVRAVRAYRQYVALAPDAADSVTVTQRIGELSALLAQLVVRVSGPSAEVTIDGERAGTTPIASPIELAPGQHTVGVTRVGHQPWSQSLNASPGQRFELDVTLETIPAPLTQAAPAPAPVTTTSPAPASATPVYKKWWLWTVVGVVVAGAAVTTGVVLGTRGASSPSFQLPAVEPR